MNTQSTIKSSLIAPCGMNCGICLAYLREKNKCNGCRGSDVDKPVTRVKCRIKTCYELKKNHSKFCFSCEDFPCTSLKSLDKRYRTKYGMSMIENLEDIKKIGIRKFTKNEKVRWACPKCGGVICVHRGHCHICGATK